MIVLSVFNTEMTQKKNLKISQRLRGCSQVEGILYSSGLMIEFILELGWYYKVLDCCSA